MRDYFVYIMSSVTKTLYIGVTNDIERRVFEHKHKLTKGFTEKHSVNHLVYYEEYDDICDAIGREKQFKNWHRQCPPVPDRTGKVNLIEKENPYWQDLSKEWIN